MEKVVGHIISKILKIKRIKYNKKLNFYRKIGFCNESSKNKEKK